MPFVDPDANTPAAPQVPLTQQLTQQDLAARRAATARTQQEMGVTAATTPLQMQNLRLEAQQRQAELQAAAQKAAAAGRYKPNAGDDATLKDLATRLAQARVLAQRSQEFIDTMGSGANSVPTGPIYGNLPIVGNLVPNIATTVSPDRVTLGKLDAINRATWALVRPPGAGQIRGYEASDWKTAFPNTANWGPVNQSIARRNQAEYEDLKNRYAKVQEYLATGKGSPTQALIDYDNQQKAKTRTAQQPQVKYLGVYDPSGP